jgi:flagellar biosynthesis GTPase FlhF
MQSKTTTAKLALSEVIRSKGLPVAVAYTDNDRRIVVLVDKEGKVQSDRQQGRELSSLDLVTLAQLASYGTTSAEEIEDILG